MSCRFVNGELVDCTLLDPNTSTQSDRDSVLSEAKQAEEDTKEPGLFGKLFGKKDGGSMVGNTFRNKEARENTVRDFLDLGALLGVTNSSNGLSTQQFEQQRQLELQRMQEMQRRNQQSSILGIPTWAFVLVLAVLLLLAIVLFSKLKSS